MNCDANSLMNAAACFRCIPAGMLGAVQVSLYCQWALGAGVTPIHWTPETIVANYIEGGVPKTGNLAFFLANANRLNVTVLDFLNKTTMTELSHVQYCPNLQTLNVQNTNVPDLDLTGMSQLTTLYAGVGFHLNTLNLTGCAAVTFINIYYNNLAVLDVSPCINLITLYAAGGPFTSLDLSSNSLLQWLDLSFANLTVSLNLTGCNSLQHLDANNGVITVPVDLTDASVLTFISAFNTGLTALIPPSDAIPLLNIDVTFNDIPTGGAGGIDDIWNKVALSASVSGTLGGTLVADGGTSGTLTGGVGNGDYVTLNALGWTQAFNP